MAGSPHIGWFGNTRRHWRLLFTMLLVVATRHTVVGQVPFRNFDFEEATFVPVGTGFGGSVAIRSAMPGWTGYFGSDQVSFVLSNVDTISSPSICIFDTNYMDPLDPYSFPVKDVIHRRYCAQIKSGWDPSAKSAALMQVGVVPANAQTLGFNALGYGNLQVTVNGNAVAVSNYQFDVRPFAGQAVELRFTAPIGPGQQRCQYLLDYVRFSPAVVSPSFVAVPESQTAEPGCMVRFFVRASGGQPLGYQWFFQKTNAVTPATTNSLLTLTNVDYSNSGPYSVTVFNSAGSVSSASFPALLNVIAPVERKPVPALSLSGQPGGTVAIEYCPELIEAGSWITLGTVTLSSPSEWYFDVTSLGAGERFYRARQLMGTGLAPGLRLWMVPAITLTGQVGTSVRIDYINAVGPINYWFPLATVSLTNSPQLYFDVTARDQPRRLYRVTAVSP